MKRLTDILDMPTMNEKTTKKISLDSRFNYFENQKRLMYLEKIMSKVLFKLNNNSLQVVSSHSFMNSIQNCTFNYESGRSLKNGSNHNSAKVFNLNSFNYIENQKRITYLEKIVIQIISKVGLNLDYFLTDDFRSYINDCTFSFEKKNNRDVFVNSSFNFSENQKRLMYLEKIVSQTIGHLNPKALEIIVSEDFIQSVNKSVQDFEQRKISA